MHKTTQTIQKISLRYKMKRWHWIWKDIYSPFFALTGSINDQGHATGLLSSLICIFITILVNTHFSHQSKRKGRKRHIYMMWCIKNCTRLLYVEPFFAQQANVVHSLPFPYFSVLLVEAYGSAHHTVFLHWMLKIQKKPCPNWVSNQRFIFEQQKTVQALQHSATTRLG
jgi:hypothetical protein